MDIDEIGKIEPKIDEVKVVKESESLFMTSNFKTEKIDNAVIIQKSNALSMLANYNDSDEDSDDTDEAGVQNEAEIYRKASESEDSESSSSSSSDSEDEKDINEIKKKIDASYNRDEESFDDEEDGQNKLQKKREPPKVKGEMFLDELPPIEDLQISVDEKECLEIGRVSSIVDQLVLVETFHNSTPLDIESILFLDRGQKALGAVFDVIGQVSAPIYCIRFNSHEDIVAKSIKIDDKVFCAPKTEHTKIVILPNIMSKKGSDASWKHDCEPPANQQEFSDDEEERKVKRQNKKQTRYSTDKPQQSHQPGHDFRPNIRGRRSNPHMSSNYSWHQNLPHQSNPNASNGNSNQNFQYPNYNYWQN